MVASLVKAAIELSRTARQLRRLQAQSGVNNFLLLRSPWAPSWGSGSISPDSTRQGGS